MIDLRRQLLGLGERIRINLCPYPHMNPRILNIINTLCDVTVALIARLAREPSYQVLWRQVLERRRQMS
jgi:hypothetical protein